MAANSTTSRTLRLLELLQARRYWPGEELAGRLGVTGRTLRRDVERLRELGYRIEASRGRVGGYVLSASSELPPLVFTPEEAAALAAALSSAAASDVAGGGELALRVLAKVEQVMPSNVRHRVRTFRSVVSIGSPPDTTRVDAELLAVLALACRDHERVRIRYTSASGDDAGSERVRRIEPIRLVPRGILWYLLCWDTAREDWRTLRVDRISDVSLTGIRTPPRTAPGGDAAAYVSSRLAAIQPEVVATVRIHAPRPEVEKQLGGYARDFTDALMPNGAPATDWRIADARAEVLASALIWVTWPFEVLDSPELNEVLRDRAARFTAATG